MQNISVLSFHGKNEAFSLLTDFYDFRQWCGWSKDECERQNPLEKKSLCHLFLNGFRLLTANAFKAMPWCDDHHPWRQTWKRFHFFSLFATIIETHWILKINCQVMLTFLRTPLKLGDFFFATVFLPMLRLIFWGFILIMAVIYHL